MVHRRLVLDDERGVGEPLNETQSITPYDWRDGEGVVHHDPLRIGQGLVVRGKFQLAVTAPQLAPRFYRRLQQMVYYEPVFAVAEEAVWEAKGLPGLKHGALPPNVDIITLEKQPQPHTLLLRLAHR